MKQIILKLTLLASVCLIRNTDCFAAQHGSTPSRLEVGSHDESPLLAAPVRTPAVAEAFGIPFPVPGSPYPPAVAEAFGMPFPVPGSPYPPAVADGFGMPFPVPGSPYPPS